jgi:hypothetical protein
MKHRETRIRLDTNDHERLRIAAAYAKLSMAEFVRRATLERIKAQEDERAARQDHRANVARSVANEPHNEGNSAS